MGAIKKLADLTDDERSAFEGWLEEFARTWSEEGLEEAVKDSARPECRWRELAVNQMVKLDLKRQWQLGRQATLSGYIERYPELGGVARVAVELIWAEVKARHRAGLPMDIEPYARSYPNQAAELRALAAKTGSLTVETDQKDASTRAGRSPPCSIHRPGPCVSDHECGPEHAPAFGPRPPSSTSPSHLGLHPDNLAAIGSKSSSARAGWDRSTWPTTRSWIAMWPSRFRSSPPRTGRKCSSASSKRPAPRPPSATRIFARFTMLG